MSTGQPHGTTRGYQAHRRDKEPACAPCVAAKTRYEKARHVYGPRSVPAIGTRRRIHALMALGHSGADIATYLGITYQAVHRLEHATTDRVWRTTAARVAAVYDELSMTRPTGHYATRVRRKAAARGYAPPLAWDDIDDDPAPVTNDSINVITMEMPKDIDEVVVWRVLDGDTTAASRATPAERAAITARWAAAGRSLRALRNVTGWKPERYWKATA